jgi:hypothetical protein
MADTKITALTAISTVDPAVDVLPIVDVSDTTMAASGTTKKITSNQILGSGGTATLASATITGDLTVATDRLKVVTGSTAVQIGSTTQTQFGTTAWPSDLIAKANSRVLVGNLGTVLLWNESAAAIGNASNLFIGAKSGAGATTFGGSYISSGIENASDRAGFFALSTFQSNGIDRERYRIDSTGVHTWQYVGGVAGTAMTLNSTGLGVGVTPSAWSAGSKAIQISSFFAAWQGSNGSSNLGFAVYEGGANTYNYRTTGDAPTFYSQLTGAHRWFTAPSGTADNAITFTQAMTLTASGNLLVGSAMPVASGRISANTSTGSAARFLTSAGDNQFAAMFEKSSTTNTTAQVLIGFTINNQATGSGQINANGASQAAFGTFSDSRLKENIVSLPSQLANILSLRPVEFDYKDGSGHQIGFVAQEMQEVYSDAVGEQNGFLTVTGWSKTEARLVSAIKELAAKVQALEAKLA